MEVEVFERHRHSEQGMSDKTLQVAMLNDCTQHAQVHGIIYGALDGMWGKVYTCRAGGSGSLYKMSARWGGLLK